MAQSKTRYGLRAGVGIALAALSVVAVADLLRRDARTLVVAGVERSYEVVVVGKQSAEPMPLVFVFHGRGGSSAAIRRRTALDTAASALGDRAIFVYPQGLELPGTHVVAWQTACDGPDMQLLDALLRELGAEFPIDRSRVFASGFSWGGEMSIAFGCCRHELVRAIAPLSGGVRDNLSDACKKHAPAYRMTIGEADSVVPANVLERLTEDFRAIQGCAQRSHETDPGCRAWDGCRVPVVQCAYPGMGHELPPNAGREIWTFFRSFGSDSHAAQ